MNEVIETNPSALTADGLVLTQGQQDAMNSFLGFLMDPIETVFVLSGYAGCGKSTLVKELLHRLPSFMQTAKLVNPHMDDYEVVLTATTNKAAEALSSIVKDSVTTIHSQLSLKVVTDYKTYKNTLVPRTNNPITNKLLFIDEASYVDRVLLQYIFSLTKNCKIVFIGDPAQLTQVNCTTAPVFNAGFKEAQLTEVVRQAKGNPIIDLATAFRQTVTTGEFFSFTPDGTNVVYMPDTDEFNEALLQEFNRPDWKYQDSKVLAWTNKTVNGYNHFIREHVKGEPMLQEGDYAVCNQFVQLIMGKSFKTDQLVQITKDEGPASKYGVMGRNLIVDYNAKVFLPNKLSDAKAALRKAQTNQDWTMYQEVNQWIDLRAAYAQTINKSQGSTYDKVFICLDDIRKCNSGDQIARMLYVGVSRARYQVYLTGDIA